MAATLLLATAGLTACSDNESEDPEDKDTSLRPRHLVITQDGATRATLSVADATLAATWTAGDELTYWNYQQKYNFQDEAFYNPTGQLRATSTASKSAFEGMVTCAPGDRLAIVYPATNSFIPLSEGDYKAKYTISLSGQDGTLSTLATHYHYVYGVATVTEVSGENATANINGAMQSLLTVCKFSFTDKATSAIIPISTLTISYGGIGSDADKYPLTATVKCGNTPTAVEVRADDATEPLTLKVRDATEAYVALLPTGGQRTFQFSITDPDGTTYTDTASATLNEGQYVVATGLVLNRQE